MFASVYPGLDRLNIMALASPQSAILSAVIFNALVIIALIPLALRGVSYRPGGAAALLRRNLLVYGVGGIVAPVRRDQAHRPAGPVPPRDGLMRTSNLFVARHLAAARALLVFTLLLGIGYPLAMVGIAQLPGLNARSRRFTRPATATRWSGVG